MDVGHYGKDSICYENLEYSDKGEGDAACSYLYVTICIDPWNVSHFFWTLPL